MARVMVWTNPGPWTNPRHPMAAVAGGLRGFDVRTCPLSQIPAEPYDVLLTWNGLHAGRDRLVPDLRRAGKPVVIVERGFFDRMNHTQIDHRGWNHTASWSHGYHGQAVAFDKLLSVIHAPEPMRPRASGYILILAQKSNDTQMWDAPWQTPDPLVRAVERAVPDGVDIRVRAHPTERYDCGPGRAEMIDGTLVENIAGARFCVTINSNAGNDAILAGCPVLCVGPSVYGQCNAATSCTPGNLPVGIAMMLRGLSPTPKYAAGYCAWLAAKQYSLVEMASGEPVRAAIEAATA